MGSSLFNSSEKIFLSFLEVLTKKGTRGTDKSNTFLAKKIGVSSAYISTMIARLVKIKVLATKKEYSRRNIFLNTGALVSRGFITKKAKRGPNKNE